MEIAEDVKAVLQNSTVRDNKLFLPPHPLDRKLYVRVNSVLELLGGKWNRAQQAHVFKANPKKALYGVLRSGAIVDAKKELQAFFTPLPVVDRLLDQISDIRSRVILEPSAGTGAIADVLRCAGATVHCVELHEEYAKELEDKGYKVHRGDFLELAAHGVVYDVIVMNPPYSKGQDVAHVRHALDFLAPGGILLAVLPPAWTFRESKLYREFREFIHGGNFFWELLPEGSFKHSGTAVRTGILKYLKSASE